LRGRCVVRKMAFLLAGLVILTSCPNSSRFGTVSVSISVSSLAAKTIGPAVDMTAAAYDVSGSGPDGAVFSRTGLTDVAFTQPDLTVGEWTIVVDAYNGAGTLVGSGNATVDVAAGETASVTVQVAPLSGNGSLTVSITWPSGLLTSPALSATLAPAGGSAQDLAFSMVSSSASYASGASLAAGYYTLSLSLKDGATTRWGCVESIRILKDLATNVSYALSEQDLDYGGTGLVITPVLANPITITLSGVVSIVPSGKGMTVSAAPSTAVDSYAWYLDGVPQAGQTGSSIDIGSGLGNGNHRLDVVVTKGNVISSEGAVFTVKDAPTYAFTTNAGETGAALDVYFYGGSTLSKPLHAIWVETMSGEYVQDLYLSTAVGANVYAYSGSRVARPMSVPYWTHKACVLDPYGQAGSSALLDTTGMYLAIPGADAGSFGAHPTDVDAVTHVTPFFDAAAVNFLVHTALKNGAVGTQFRVLCEINRSRDWNSTYTNPAAEPNGQPSLIYAATIDTSSGRTLYQLSLIGSGDPDNTVADIDGALHVVDGTITTALDQVAAVVIELK
jgi:hypothetical protein